MQLSQIRTAIQNLGYGSDTAAQQTQFINDTYHQVNSKNRWSFLEKQDGTLTTTPGTNAYSMPGSMEDYRNIDAMRIGQDALQNWDNLEYMQPQDLRDLEHTDRTQGMPRCWTFINQQIHLYPFPDGVYTITIDYVIQPPDLAADGDIPIWPDNYHDILVWGAVHSIAYRQRDWLGRQDASQEFEKRLLRMEEEFNVKQRQTSSHVRRARRSGSRYSSFIPFGW